jgi:hypothetical protein
LAQVPDYERIAREFGLGRPLEVRPLADGHPSVVKLTTELGQFVVKPAYGAAQAQLYEHVALTLNRAGIRQARLSRTAARRRRHLNALDDGHALDRMTAIGPIPVAAPPPACTAHISSSGCRQEVQQDAAVVESKATYALIKAH